jgi:uncharacterized repeat protein (TIGR01451 family)
MFSRHLRRWFAFGSDLQQRAALRRRFLPQVEGLEDRVVLDATVNVSVSAPATVVAGNNLSYTLSLTNSGPDPILNATLSDSLPSGVTFVSQTQTSGPAFTLSGGSTGTDDSISSMPANTTAVFSVVVAVPGGTTDGTVLSDTAAVETTTTLTSSSTTSASVNTTVSNVADLQVTQTGAAVLTAGSYVTYQITLANNGPDTAYNISLSDNLPYGLTLLAQTQSSGPSFALTQNSSGVSDTGTALADGATATFLLTAQLNSGAPPGTQLSNTASVYATSFDPDTSNNSPTVTSTVYSYGPVSVTNPGTQNSTEGSSVSLSISASDASGGSLSFLADGLPPGLVINPGTGAITGTVGIGAAGSGPYTTTVTASDGTYAASQSFTWNVSSPVSLTNPGTQSSTEGSSVSLSLSASDSGSGTLSYAATGLPPGLAINTGTGAITGTLALDAAAGGPYSVIVTAADGTYSTSQSFTWNVSSPVTLTAVPDQTSTEGASVSLALSASDSSSGTLSFGAVGLPPGLKINPSTGAITGTIALAAAAGGPYSVSVTAGDGTYSASQTFTWNVNSPIVLTTPADQTSSEGASVSLSITATGGGSLSYGAVGLPGGLSINAGTGAITGTVAVGDAADGPYTVTLFAADGTSSASTSFTWNVTSPVSITTPDDQSNAEGNSVALTITASTTTTSGTLSYSATDLPSGLSINSSTGAITGTLTAGGSFQPTVTASDGTYSASTSFAWDVSSPISITDPGTQDDNAGDAVSLQVQASDSSSGTLTYSASGLPSGLSINSSTGDITGTLSSALSPGTYTTALSVTDGSNTGVDSFGFTIYPTSTVVVTNPGTQNNTEGDAVSLSLSASYSGSGTLKYAAVGLPAGLAISPSTGAITGTVGAGDSGFGPYQVTVTASDGTAWDSQTCTWNISSPITLTNPGTQSSTEGGSVSLSLSASYSGSGSLSYSAVGLPPGLTLNPSTGAITGTIALDAAASGPYAVTVQAAVGAYTAVQSFTWNVSSPISITTPADQTNSEGASVSLSISASDSSSGTLTYAAVGLPTGLSINATTGAITGTVAVGTAANGPYAVTVVAADGTYSNNVSFNWTVNSPVSITMPADQTNNEGDSVSLSISASDSSSGTLKYAALGLPTGLVINPSTGAITGTIAAGAADNGPYSVTIEAGDGTYSSATSFTWNVNSPVSITQSDDQTNNEGDSISLAISASDAHSGGTLTYSATGLPNGVSINSSTGDTTGTASAGGWWQPTITAGDGTYSNSVSFNWTVTSPVTIADPGAQFNQIGDSVSFAITAADTASGTLSYSATGLPTGLSINSSTGAVTGTVSTGASTTSPYSTTITVSDGTSSAVDTFSWKISPAGAVVITSPGSQTNTVGDEVLLPLQATDSTGGTLLYTATGLPAGLYLNLFTGEIFGSPSAATMTGMPASVTVTAGDGSNSASLTFSWTVNAAGTVTLTNPGDQTNNEGDAVSLSLSATDSGSGTLRYAAFGLPPGLAINTSTGAITGSIAPGDAASGPYIVTVVANDGTYSATQTFAWTVNNPVTLTPPGDQTNSEGDSVSLSVSGSDATTGPLSYSALGLPAGLKINPTTGALTGTVAVGAAADGPYTVVVTAGDGTYAATQSFTWTITSPVSITQPADQSNDDGNSVSLAISARTTGSGTLTYSAQGLPPGLAINPSTGAISGTVTVGASGIGSYSPTIIVSDGTYSNSVTFNWTVNSLVSLSDPGDQSNTVGDSVALTLSATDAGSGTPVYVATALPAGLSLNPSTGEISGTIGSGATAIGSYLTTIVVEDGTYSAVDAFTWTIAAAGPVTLTTPSNQSSSEGATASLSLSASGSGTLSYFALGLPAGLKINPSTGAITGTIAAGVAANGPYAVTVLATNGTDSASETFTWTVTGPVSLAAIADQTNQEGNTVSLSVSGSDSGSGTLTYTAVGLPGGLKINPSTGAITGTVGLGGAANGPYDVTVTAADGTSSASQTFTWAVTSPITLTAVVDQTNYEGDSITGLSVSATDSTSGTLKYSAVGLPPGLKINPTSGAITGTVAVGAALLGPYTVVVTAGDGTYSATETFTWTVNCPITITNPGDQTNELDDNVTLKVGVNNSAGGTLTYTAVGLPEGLSINASGVITGTISEEADVGVSTLTITVTNGTYTARTTFDWWVYGFQVDDKGGEKAEISPGNLTAPVTPKVVAASADGKVVAAFDPTTHTIKLWNSATMKPIAVFTMKPQVNSIAFSPTDPDLLAIGLVGQVVLYSISKGAVVASVDFLNTEATAISLAFRPDGKSLVAGGNKAVNKQSGMVWTVNGKGDKATLTDPIPVQEPNVPVAMQSVAFTETGITSLNIAKASDTSGTACLVWTLAPNGKLYQFDTSSNDPSEHPATAIAVSQQRGILVVGHSNGTIEVFEWDGLNKKPRLQFFSTSAETGKDPILSVQLFPVKGGVQMYVATGKTITSYPFEEGTAWKLGKGSWTKDLTALGNGGIDSMTLTPDGKVLIVGGKDGTVQFLNAADGKPIGDPLK